jgi:putative membrane protein
MGDWMLGPGWGWLFMALLLAGLVLVVVVLVRVLAGGVGGGPAAGGGGVAGQRWARQILAERYARGQISTEEYRARLRALGRG